MNRNVSMVVAILVLVVIAGYLIWLRSRVAPTVSPRAEEQVQTTATASATAVASSSAVPGAKEATSSVKAKSATSSSTKK